MTKYNSLYKIDGQKVCTVNTLTEAQDKEVIASIKRRPKSRRPLQIKCNRVESFTLYVTAFPESVVAEAKETVPAGLPTTPDQP
jgi:hypothetical protein